MRLSRHCCCLQGRLYFLAGKLISRETAGDVVATAVVLRASSLDTTITSRVAGRVRYAISRTNITTCPQVYILKKSYVQIVFSPLTPVHNRYAHWELIPDYCHSTRNSCSNFSSSRLFCSFLVSLLLEIHILIPCMVIIAGDVIHTR